MKSTRPDPDRIVTVTPIVNHDRLRRGRRYELRYTADVIDRVRSGLLRIVDDEDQTGR